MSRNHESNNSTPAHAAIFRFLDAYENETYSDDDGALLVRTEHGHLERVIGGDVALEK